MPARKAAPGAGDVVMTRQVADASPVANASSGDSTYLLGLALVIRSQVPLLATVGLLVALAGAVVAATTVSVAVLAPVVAAVLLGPVWLGATATCYRLLEGEAPGIRDLWAETRRRART